MLSIKAVTFDYFGTLVDCDAGGASGARKLLSMLDRRDIDPVALYADWDRRTVQAYRGGSYRRYRDVAIESLAAALETVAPGITKQADVAAATETLLSGLVECAKPFPEVVEIVDKLARRYPLMPITNMDSDLFARSQLASRFPHATTAEMARAYKPSERIFRLALDRLAVTPEDVLHVSLSPWADIDGAKPLGMRVAWINRTGESLGPWSPKPDWEFPDMNGLRPLLDLH